VSHSPLEQRILIRLSGEVSTKAKPTRRQFVGRLVRNAKDALARGGVEARIERHYERLIVTTHQGDAAVEVLRRVFGIQSLALTEPGSAESLEAVATQGYEHFHDRVAGKHFAVRARRVGNKRPGDFGMRDLERELGARLLPDSAGVDLSNPETTVHVEIFEDHAHFFSDNVTCEAGLPLGTGDTAVALVSGGFDSAVAAWQLHRRGVELDYVFCNLGGRTHQLETITIARRIAERWQCGSRPRFVAVDFDLVSREIQAKVETRYWQVVLKRLMLRAAEAVASSSKASAIVTGDAIGQVSSQTLQNVAVISDGATLPILRPLVGSNKDEIIAESRHVGTHDLSEKVGEYCAIVPSRPATQAKLDVVLAEEAKLDPSVLETAIAERSEFLLFDLDLDAWAETDLAVSKVEKADVVIDLRSRSAYDAWHYPEALFLEFAEALRAYASFGKDQRYILYCEFGLKSAHLADLMRRAGLEAQHISGGLREAKRLADSASES